MPSIILSGWLEEAPCVRLFCTLSAAVRPFFSGSVEYIHTTTNPCVVVVVPRPPLNQRQSWQNSGGFGVVLNHQNTDWPLSSLRARVLVKFPQKPNCEAQNDHSHQRVEHEKVGLCIPVRTGMVVASADWILAMYGPCIWMQGTPPQAGLWRLAT